MDLYTRCTHCETVFRVTTRELQASGGRVRCGYCHRVFDAFASLSAQEPQAAEPQAGELPSEEPQGADRGAKQQPAATEPAAPSSAPAPAMAVVATEPPRAKPDPAASLYEWEFKVAPPPRRTVLWSMVSLLLVLAAAAQAAYAFQTQILMHYPQVRPLFERACSLVGCEVGLPRQAEWLDIQASDLQLPDPARPNEVELTALVRNRARVAVDYPAFELTLTDSADRVIARRVFLPAEYLGREADSTQGLQARAELPLRLYLDTGNVRASGYRLYLFYPS